MRHTEAEAAGWWFDLTNFVYGFGGQWSDDNGNPTVNSDAVVQGVEAFKRVYDAGVIPEGTDAATYRRMAWEGKIAMMIDNASVPQILASENPAMTDDIVAVPIPFPEPEHAMIVGFVAINGASRTRRRPRP